MKTDISRPDPISSSIKNRVKIVGWLPVSGPFRLPRLYYPEDYNERLKEFSSGLCEALPVLEPSIKRVKTSIKVPGKDIIKDLQSLNKKFFDYENCRFIKVECWSEFDKMTFQQSNPDLDVSILYDNTPFFAADLLSLALTDALIFAELAFPSRIKCRAGCIYWKRNRMHEISDFHGIYREALTNEQFSWPSVQTLPYVKAFQWAEKLGLFDRGIGRSPIQRALASFTHLFLPRFAQEECGAELQAPALAPLGRTRRLRPMTLRVTAQLRIISFRSIRVPLLGYAGFGSILLQGEW